MTSENRNRIKLEHEDLGSFFENMGMMIKAGITVSEAADLLKEDSGKESALMASALGKMSGKLQEGASLGDAMKATDVFPDYAVDMVSASEYTGRLEDTLFHLSDYYRTEQKMKTKFISAVRYPVILLFMVIAVLAAMLFMVFPAFYGVYNNLTGSLASSSYNYINISFTLCRVMLVVMAVLVVVLLAGIAVWRSGGQEKVRKMLSGISTFRLLFENLDLM